MNNNTIVNKLSMNKCNGCEACYNICPVNAILMTPDQEGFLYPAIIDKKCIDCAKCITVCPVLHYKNVEKEQKVKAFAGYNVDTEVRLKSTSGGIFDLLARYYMDTLQGVVAATIFGENFQQTHFIISGDTKDIDKMRGSKYLQSCVNQTYRDIKQFLILGREVLFVGLPCQVEGLLKFLNKQFDNLFCIDMVCYGVPSPAIWKKYIQENYRNERIQNIVFKSKEYGWKHWSFKVSIAEKNIIESGRNNIYMKSFLSNINIRPACFSCQFKGMNRRSDLTIADCWGDGEKNQELNDDKGLSAIIIQSEKANKVWNQIAQNMHYMEYDPDILMRGNWAMFQTPVMNENREMFYKNKDTYTLQELVSRYC